MGSCLNKIYGFHRIEAAHGIDADWVVLAINVDLLSVDACRVSLSHSHGTRQRPKLSFAGCLSHADENSLINSEMQKSRHQTVLLAMGHACLVAKVSS